MFKVLLVDENAYLREQLGTMLDWKGDGFILEAYADYSSDVIAFMDKQDISLILIDMKGSRAEGLRLCDRIRRHSQVPIIFVGGDYDFELARKALHYQVSDFLPDPIRPSDLLASLKVVMGKLEAGSAANAFPRPSAAEPSDKKDSAPSSIIEDVKKYVQEKLHHNVTLKEISSLFHFNSAYLGQKFKSKENMSFNEYLLQQRMEKAKDLLERTDMRIYEIAKKVGYTEIDWFYKKFKEYTGVSANEYRKMASITA